MRSRTTSFCLILMSAVAVGFGIEAGAQGIVLFDNGTLDGWTTEGNIQADFKNGAITLYTDSDQAMLLSDARYNDFVLRGECFLNNGTKGAILFRYEGEAQGYSASLNHSADQQNPSGSITNVARGTWLPGFDTAGWFPFQLWAKGDYLKVVVDDVIIAQTHDRHSLGGRIGFELVKGSKLQFRDMTITTISGQVNGPDIRNYFDAHFETPFQYIFDGETLSDWSEEGEATWSVEDGVIHGNSGEKGGFLVSEGIYKNFHLILDFRILKEDNSGIFIRKPSDAETVSTENSIECNIYDHNGFTHAYSTGSLATHARAWSNLINYDKWNTAEIMAWEDQVAMYINGVKASHADLPEFNHAGNICLQAGIRIFSDQGPSDIFFRNIRIKSID